MMVVDGTFVLLREIAAVDSRVIVVKVAPQFWPDAGLSAALTMPAAIHHGHGQRPARHDPADIPLS